MAKKHSAVCYVYHREDGYKPEEKAHTVKNDLGLDLFRFQNRLYEGQTGLQIHDTTDLSGLKDRIERIGGMENLQQIMDENIQETGYLPDTPVPMKRERIYFHLKETRTLFLPPKPTARNTTISDFTMKTAWNCLPETTTKNFLRPFM